MPMQDIARIHDRMPVIIQPQHYQAWLDKSVSDPGEVKELCRPPLEGGMIAYRVSPAIHLADAQGP